MSDIVKDIILKLIIEKIIQALPWLGAPVINPVFVWLFTKIFNVVYDELEVYYDFIKIDIKTEHEQKKYDQATEVLKTAIESQDQQEIENAKELYKKYLKNLVSMRSN